MRLLLHSGMPGVAPRIVALAACSCRSSALSTVSSAASVARREAAITWGEEAVGQFRRDHRDPAGAVDVVHLPRMKWDLAALPRD